MKTDNEVVFESLVARIRDLESELAASNEKAEAVHQYNVSVTLAFSKYIRCAGLMSNGESVLANFEEKLSTDISKGGAVEDSVEAYLWVMEIARDEGLLEPNGSHSISEAYAESIEAKITEYNAILVEYRKKKGV